MAKQYNLKNICALLTEGFTTEELRRLCYEELDFRPVYNKLAQDTGKVTIIDWLLEYASQKLHIEVLLIWAKEHNPAMYEAYHPYHDISSSPTSFSSIHGKFRRGEETKMAKQQQPNEEEKNLNINSIRDSRVNVDSDTITLGNIGPGAAVAVGRNASANINRSALLQSELQTIVEKLIAEVRTELKGDDLIKYARAAETLKQQMLADNPPSPSFFKQVIRTISLLDTTNGSLELMSKVWPLTQALITIAATNLK